MTALAGAAARAKAVVSRTVVAHPILCEAGDTSLRVVIIMLSFLNQSG
jgi:hypothetical protein